MSDLTENFIGYLIAFLPCILMGIGYLLDVSLKSKSSKWFFWGGLALCVLELVFMGCMGGNPINKPD